MSLNIKNPETVRLARKLAELTGETMTGAITESVRERLERVARNEAGLADRLLAIGRDAASRLPGPQLTADHADLLFGPDGLPR
jgi:antitoxin VapB